MTHMWFKRMLCAVTAVFLVVGFAGCTANGSENSDRSFFKQSIKSGGTSFYKHTAKRFDGTYQIKTITLDAKSKIDVELTIESGDYRLVLVNTDKESDQQEILLLDHDYNDTLDLSGVAPGKYALKMIGDKASFQLRIDFSEGVASEEEKTRYALRAENYDGVYPIQTLTVGPDTAIEAFLDIQSGEVQLFLIKEGDGGQELQLLNEAHDGTLDLSNVAPGEYTLQMRCAQANFSVKLVFTNI